MRKGRIISSYIQCGLSSQGNWLGLTQAIEKRNPDVYHNNLQTFLENLFLPHGDTSKNCFSLPLTSLKLFWLSSSHFCPFYLRPNTAQSDEWFLIVYGTCLQRDKNYTTPENQDFQSILILNNWDNKQRLCHFTLVLDPYLSSKCCTWSLPSSYIVNTLTWIFFSCWFWPCLANLTSWFGFGPAVSL